MKFKVVIAGGGTAGWMTACGLSSKLADKVDIVLIESDSIGTVGVGEATIPSIKYFHRELNIDEQEFMRETQATFKLGITFDNWGDIGESYMHSFGEIGKKTWGVHNFYETWLEARSKGYGGDLENYCLEIKAAKAKKFSKDLQYAFHFDSTSYANYLRQIAEKAKVNRIEGVIKKVQINAESGEIDSLLLEDGNVIEGNLFIDCTGFQSLLLGQALGVEFNDWSNYLAADRAVAVQSVSLDDPVPYTKSIAHSAGWQWQIPLQNRIGNGLVYSSKFLSDDEALHILSNNVLGDMITEPKLLKYKTGHREKFWHKNCVAIGLSSGFLEPLESTSIHLILTSIFRLIDLFPFDGMHNDLKFNQESLYEIKDIRDFIILHYKQTNRSDSEFWNMYRNMNIPESLASRISYFKEHGIIPNNHALFTEDSWFHVMLGQGIEPKLNKNPPIPDEGLKQSLAKIQNSISSKIETFESHEKFINKYVHSSYWGI